MQTADIEILNHYNAVRRKTIELVDLIPESFLVRKPKGEDVAIYKLFLHIVKADFWWSTNILGLDTFPLPDFNMNQSSVTGHLSAAAKNITAFYSNDDSIWNKAFKSPTGNELSGREILMHLSAHEVHHRGKMIIALRQWGLEGFPTMPREY